MEVSSSMLLRKQPQAPVPNAIKREESLSEQSVRSYQEAWPHEMDQKQRNAQKIHQEEVCSRPEAVQHCLYPERQGVIASASLEKDVLLQTPSMIR